MATPPPACINGGFRVETEKSGLIRLVDLPVGQGSPEEGQGQLAVAGIPGIQCVSAKGGEVSIAGSLLDELVGALTEEGAVDPKRVHAEALRLYLNTHPALKLHGAVALWRKG
jgi:hypothetical protein